MVEVIQEVIHAERRPKQAASTEHAETNTVGEDLSVDGASR